MSITDELREYAEDWDWLDTGAERAQDRIEAIADRIDAEHEESIQREHENAYDVGYVEGMGVANKADMRAEYLRGKNDGYDEGWDAAAKTMTERMVELPKDADGEHIHIGDKLIDEDDKLQKPAIVKCILYNDEGCVVSDIDPRGCWYDPSLLRHHHTPTVEDVLREFANEVYADADNEIRDRDFLCAKYAKRLTLAEGEDA